MAARGRGLISLYVHRENLKNLLVQKCWLELENILHTCSLWYPLPRLLKDFQSLEKHGCQVAELIFLICALLKLQKSSCPKVLAQFKKKKNCTNVSWDTLYQDCSKISVSMKNMASKRFNVLSWYTVFFGCPFPSVYIHRLYQIIRWSV